MACSGSLGLPVFFFQSLEAKDTSHGWSRSSRPFHIRVQTLFDVIRNPRTRQTRFPSPATVSIKQPGDAVTESGIILAVEPPPPHFADMKT